MFVHVRPKSGGALYINTDHIVMVERVNNKVHFANGESVFLTQEGYADLMYEICTHQARERGDASEDIKAENVKLRELVRDMCTCMCNITDADYTCKDCLLSNDTRNCDFERRMEELGIEAE